jgi:lipoprotein-anchoring transpeptidase ErfK/SrfK
MRLLTLSRHIRLLAVPLLGLMFASPTSAQTNSASEIPNTGTAGAQIQSESTGRPTSSDPATPKTGSDAATPITESNSTAAQTESAFAAETSSQPLTRADCGKAGMRWSEGANVCTESTSTAAQAEAKPESTPGAEKTGSAVFININKTKQKMTVSIDGIEKYDWPVSTGRAGYSTPSGTYTPTSMNEVWYSQQWDNAPMPHAIFFMKDGHAIHGSYEVKTLGKPVSHGCVRISPQNAATLYSLVGKNGLENTQVVLTGVTPGGESKVASSAGPRSRGESKVASPAGLRSHNGQAGPGRYKPGDNNYAQLQRRRGFFGRLFGGPYYNGPQGYYRPPPAY